MLGVPIRRAALVLGLIACQPPPLATPQAEDEVSRVEPSTERGSLPEAIAIEGLPDPPATWPQPVPTIMDDGALSIRALRLDPDPLLARAAEGEVVRVRVLVQGQEPETGEPIRTWCVDRAIDLHRLDQGMAIEPPLQTSRAGERIELVGVLEQRALAEGEEPSLVLRAIAWTDEAATNWQSADGSPVAADSWPRVSDPSPRMRRAIEALPLELGEDREQAFDFLARAALADDGALAERHARRALQLSPDDVEVWSTLIAIYHGYGQHEHHLAAMKAARPHVGAEFDALWLEYGRLDVTIGEFVHAIALLEQAVALAPDNLQAHFYLATAHWLLGERQAAKPSYAKVIELAGPVHSAIEFMMIETARNRLAELGR